MSVFRNPNHDVKYLFVDGGCLREVLKDYSERFFNGEPIEFDYNSLRGDFQKVFYYDSLPVKNNDESDSDYEIRVQAEIDFFDYLNVLDGYHVFEGTARRRRKRIEQKKVDIMIAVDMLNHSFRNTMSKATLLTSDLDFKPLIDALVDNGMYVSLLYPPNKTNPELIKSADSGIKLNLERIFNYSTADFRTNHPIPSGKDKIGVDLHNVDRIDEYTNKAGIHGKFFKGKSNKMFYLIFPTNFNPKANTHIEFNNLELLKEYFNDYTYK